MASEQMGVAPENCVVIEDSLVGLRAAKGAGMKCIITYTASTKDEDFYAEGADAVIEDLSNVSLAFSLSLSLSRSPSLSRARARLLSLSLVRARARSLSMVRALMVF